MTSISNDSTLSPRTQRDTRRMNWFVSIAAAVAGLLFGLDIGVISGALPFITDHFTLSSQLQEWVVSSMMLGAAIGALFNGWLSFRLGRKYSLMAGAVLFVAGSIGSAFAASVEVLLVARVVLGVAVGIASYTAPLYLSEMASENVRGKMISMYQLMVTLGIVLAFLSDTAFSYSGNWRAMLGVLALPALLLIVLVIFLPNSPRWLAQKGRHVEAEEVLRMLRDTSEKAREELNEIRESLKLKQGGWALFKINRNVRRAVFLGMLLQAMQQFTGMNIIMDNPKTVGSDMIVDAVAAIREYPGPIIIIDMGTATTMSVVDKNGNYIGGIIYPGLRVSLDSLSSKTAQLPSISLDIPKRVIGKNTIDCMRSGIMYGNAGMIDGILEHMEEELGEPATIIATGGLSRFVVPLCKHKIIYDDALLLKGLMIIYEKNKA